MTSVSRRWSIDRFLRHRWVRFLHRSRELLVTLLFYMGLIATPFGEPELAVRYEVIKLHPPSSLVAREGEPSTTVLDPDDDESLRAILESASMMIIYLENTTSKTIEDLELHVRARSVAGVALHSNSSRIMRQDEQPQVQDLEEGVVTLQHLELVPPQSYIEVILWGDFMDEVGKRPLEVRASAESIDIDRQKKSSGIALLVEENANFLFMALFALGLVLLLKRIGSVEVDDADG